jgi:formylglycine-generating enzyme required for sulfatase activity
MHGNVFEWCQDWHDSDYYNNSPGENLAGPAKRVYRVRVTRGGSWGHDPGSCRSANRRGCILDDRYHSLGFRVATFWWMHPAGRAGK